MAKARVLCIEIGYLTTKICEIDYKIKNPKIYQCIEIDTPDGIVSDGYLMRDRLEDLKEQILAKLAEKEIKTKKVIFSVYSSKIITREVTLPSVKLKQVANVIDANLSEYFPMELEEYVVTHTILHTYDKEDENAGRHRALVVAAEKDLLRNYETLAELCGWTLENIDYMGNAIQQAVKPMVGHEAELFVKIEPENAIVTIMKDGTLALQRSVHYGIGRPIMGKEDLADAMELIVGTMLRIIDFYVAQAEGNYVSAINVIGTYSEYAEVLSTIQEKTGIRTQYIPNVQGFGLTLTVTDDVWISAYIGCIGASIAPLGMMNIQPKGKMDVDYFTSSILMIVLVIVASVAIVVTSLLPYQAQLLEEAKLKQQEQIYLEAKALYEEYAAALKLYEHVDFGKRSTEHANDALLVFLAELEEKLPTEASLESFLSDDLQCIMSMSVADKETAAGVIKTLREFDSIMSVTVNSVVEDESESGAKVVKFTVTCLYYPVTLEAPVSADLITDDTTAEVTQ